MLSMDNKRENKENREADGQRRFVRELDSPMPPPVGHKNPSMKLRNSHYPIADSQVVSDQYRLQPIDDSSLRRPNIYDIVKVPKKLNGAFADNISSIKEGDQVFEPSRDSIFNHRHEDSTNNGKDPEAVERVFQKLNFQRNQVPNRVHRF